MTITVKNNIVISVSKVKTEELKKKKEAAELECTDLKAEMKKVVLDMEQLLREKVPHLREVVF